MADRQLAIGKRFSLSGAFDGWDDSCYVIYRPASIRDKMKLREGQFEDNASAAAIDFMLGYAKGQVIGGKVKVLGEDGKPALADLEPADIEVLPDEMLGELFAAINGVTLDPKASSPAAEPASEPESSEAPTATS